MAAAFIAAGTGIAALAAGGGYIQMESGKKENQVRISLDFSGDREFGKYMEDIGAVQVQNIPAFNRKVFLQFRQQLQDSCSTQSRSQAFLRMGAGNGPACRQQQYLFLLHFSSLLLHIPGLQ